MDNLTLLGISITWSSLFYYPKAFQIQIKQLNRYLLLYTKCRIITYLAYIWVCTFFFELLNLIFRYENSFSSKLLKDIFFSFEFQTGLTSSNPHWKITLVVLTQHCEWRVEKSINIETDVQVPYHLTTKCAETFRSCFNRGILRC